MAIKVYRPINPGLRKTSVLKNKELTTERPLKSLITFRKQHSGRNNTGRITVRHKGGGHKRFIRVVDFKRDKYDIEAKVERLEYDPNRNVNIALVIYADGERRYVLASEQLKVGDKIVSSKNKVEIKDGNRTALKNIPTGMQVYDIELAVGGGGKMCRSAGNAAVLMALDAGKANLRLPSGEVRMVSQDAAATMGVPSNAEYRNIRWGKAGRMRHRGIRPTVRGKAMNPVDHPHGGGEGKHPIGMKQPKTYKGKFALGVKTRKSKKYSNRLIVKRRKNKNSN